jgi:hypothetical protein
MIAIICGFCNAYTGRFGIRPDGIFQCDGCADLLAPQEIDVDDDNIWAVGPDGTLGIVTDPAVSLEEMAASLDEYMSAPHDSYGELAALRKLRDAASRLADAYQAGIPYPHGRMPEDRPPQVGRPAPSAPALCPSCGGHSLLHAESDGTFVCLTCDWFTTTEDIPGMLGDDDWTVYATGELGQIDSGELEVDTPQEARLCCPKCRTGKVALTCRQWCHCTECDWGGMEFEALYYGES